MLIAFPWLQYFKGDSSSYMCGQGDLCSFCRY